MASPSGISPGGTTETLIVEGVRSTIPTGTGTWNPTHRKVRDEWGTRQSASPESLSRTSFGRIESLVLYCEEMKNSAISYTDFRETVAIIRAENWSVRAHCNSRQVSLVRTRK